jgi:hypothetical protein
MVVFDCKLSLLLLGALISAALAQAPEGARIERSLTTREHLKREAWWPTKQFPDQSQFGGTQACAGCHGGIARSQSTSEMALTMMPAAHSPVLARHRGQVFSDGPYKYAVESAAGSFVLRISDGAVERTKMLQWTFGSGTPGQGYGWWDNGQFYESRFNYFSTLHGFDRTPGRLQGEPVSLDMAEGRKVADFEARRCYACHSTALTSTEPLSAAQFHPGITCEGCHGPGRDHIAAIRDAASDELHIVNPAKFTPVQAVDFCGACHGTRRDVELAGTLGKITVRFPAYRLEKSRCWGVNGDVRLTCFACHDPHRALQREAAAYDVACLRCHANGTAGGEHGPGQQGACPVAKSRCTSCHMPKVNLAGDHSEFTDHDIRVVNNNVPFPD